MTQYDEDRVIALLRDAVPAVPDGPDRLTAIRVRAGRQRAALWTQSIGAMASVLLVVGVAAAVAGPGDGGSVRPVDRPLAALEDALAHEKSVRFEASVSPVGEIRTTAGDSLDATELSHTLSSHATGAATSDGDLQIDGDLSIAILLGEPDALDDMHLRIVDGTFYRSALPFDNAPKTATWVREAGETVDIGTADLLRGLRMVAAVAEDVRYVKNATVRGTAVAEYALTVPQRYTHTVDIVVTFDLDAKDRLRQVAAEFSPPSALFLGGITDTEFSSSVSSGTVTYGSSSTTVGAQLSPRPSFQPSYHPATPSYYRPTPSASPTTDTLAPFTLRVELDLFGYGEDVGIVAPPANETVDSSSLEDETSSRVGPSDPRLTDCMRTAKTAEAAQACFDKYGGTTYTGGYATPIMVTPEPVFATMAPATP
jgi:hypothetical protein